MKLLARFLRWLFPAPLGCENDWDGFTPCAACIYWCDGKCTLHAPEFADETPDQQARRFQEREVAEFHAKHPFEK